MKRRDLVKGAGVAALAAGLTACGAKQSTGSNAAKSDVKLQWKMVTSWPTNFPGLGTGAAALAEMITKASGGRITVKVFGAGEMASAFEVFRTFTLGCIDCNHMAEFDNNRLLGQC